MLSVKFAVQVDEIDMFITEYYFRLFLFSFQRRSERKGSNWC